MVEQGPYGTYRIELFQPAKAFHMGLVNLFRRNKDLIRIFNCERGRRERTRSSFYMHVWNPLKKKIGKKKVWKILEKKKVG